MPILWRIPETDYLVDERRRRNEQFHSIEGTSRVEFWESVARRINRRFYTNYTYRQCEQRWRNLVNNYRVSKKIVIKK
jgi:hypothetical protein